MVTRSLGDLLFGKTRQAVLGLLFTRPDESFHLRQIVRLTGAALGPVQREMCELVAAGVTRREPRGRQVFYQVNQSHEAYSELRALVARTVGLADVLRAALRPLAGSIRFAMVFGSFAGNAQHRESDVDLLIVGDVTIRQLSSVLSEPQRRLGRDINPTVYSPSEFAAKVHARQPFLTNVLAGRKIYLIGDERESAAVVGQRVDSPSSLDAAGGGRVAGSHRP
jgi:predicted nucleotidyltransferase